MKNKQIITCKRLMRIQHNMPHSGKNLADRIKDATKERFTRRVKAFFSKKYRAQLSVKHKHIANIIISLDEIKTVITKPQSADGIGIAKSALAITERINSINSLDIVQNSNIKFQLIFNNFFNKARIVTLYGESVTTTCIAFSIRVDYRLFDLLQYKKLNPAADYSQLVKLQNRYSGE